MKRTLLLVTKALSSCLLALLLSLLTMTKNSSYGWPDGIGLRAGQEGENIGNGV